jgi:hypothetical protein
LHCAFLGQEREGPADGGRRSAKELDCFFDAQFPALLNVGGDVAKALSVIGHRFD